MEQHIAIATTTLQIRSNLLRGSVATAWLKLYSQTGLDQLRAEHRCMSYNDKLVTAAVMVTRLHRHVPPLPPDLTQVNVPHCLDLIYSPAPSVIKAPSCGIHMTSLYVS